MLLSVKFKYIRALWRRMAGETDACYLGHTLLATMLGICFAKGPHQFRSRLPCGRASAKSLDHVVPSLRFPFRRDSSVFSPRQVPCSLPRPVHPPSFRAVLHGPPSLACGVEGEGSAGRVERGGGNGLQWLGGWLLECNFVEAEADLQASGMAHAAGRGATSTFPLGFI